jgi:uncharacterized protein YegJ (DUF2314 family)
VQSRQIARIADYFFKETHMKFYFIVALLLGVVTANATENISLIPSAHAKMNAAIATAQRTLDDFLRQKATFASNESDYTLKVLFENGENKEHMWVQPFRTADNQKFEGILKSIPNGIPSLQWGQKVNFSRSQISDWGYTRSGVRIGYFTTCVLLQSDPAIKKKYEGDGLRYECAAK